MSRRHKQSALNAPATTEPSVPPNPWNVPYVAEAVTITPALATDWLERNHDNQPIVQTRVQSYTRMMLAGQWLVNNQGIGFDTNGRLVDGQHRLWAIVEAGISVRMLVIRGMQPEAHKTIDTGKSRPIREILRRDAKIPSPKNTAMWCSSAKRVLHNSTTAVTTFDVEAYYDRRKRSVDWAIDAFGDQRFRLAGLWSSLIHAHDKYPQAVEAFTAALLRGTGLAAKDPAFLLREWLLRSRGPGYRVSGGITVSTIFLKTLRAVQAHIRGEELSTLIASRAVLDYFAAPGDPTPSPGPS